jgi:hypothetical protein
LSTHSTPSSTIERPAPCNTMPSAHPPLAPRPTPHEARITDPGPRTTNLPSVSPNPAPHLHLCQENTQQPTTFLTRAVPSPTPHGTQTPHHRPRPTDHEFSICQSQLPYPPVVAAKKTPKNQPHFSLAPKPEARSPKPEALTPNPEARSPTHAHSL